MSAHETPYGSVVIERDAVTIDANVSQLWAWSHRPGNAWPCSDLDDLESISATFDASGLVDLEQDPPYDQETGAGEILSEEFNAWSSDVLREVLPKSHPAYFVTVGQFEESER